MNDHPALLYLSLAALCLVLALHYVKQVLAPNGTVVRALSAAAAVAFALGVALVLVAAAVLSH